MFKAQIALWIMLIAASGSQALKFTDGVPADVRHVFAGAAFAATIAGSGFLGYFVFRLLSGREHVRPWTKREIRVLIPLAIVGIALAAYCGYQLARGYALSPFG
jgi:hypothetical protein